LTVVRKKGRARITGEHYTHRYLWHAAQTLAVKGRADETGGVLLMAATIFAYFAFEAYLNYIGPIVCPDEWLRERAYFGGEGGEQYRGTLGKAWLLTDRLGLKRDRSRRPYQTLVDLDTRRDAVVHGRTEQFDVAVAFKDPQRIKRVDPVIYEFADETFVARVLEDVESIGDTIQRAAQEKLGEADIWSPRAFLGIMGHKSGSILGMPSDDEQAV
jgi:hypothetical protein